MAYVVELEDEDGTAPDIPTTLLRSVHDCPVTETNASIDANNVLIQKLTQVRIVSVTGIRQRFRCWHISVRTLRRRRKLPKSRHLRPQLTRTKRKKRTNQWHLETRATSSKARASMCHDGKEKDGIRIVTATEKGLRSLSNKFL